jgi:hypothetical protein
MFCLTGFKAKLPEQWTTLETFPLGSLHIPHSFPSFTAFLGHMIPSPTPLKRLKRYHMKIPPKPFVTQLISTAIGCNDVALVHLYYKALPDRLKDN